MVIHENGLDIILMFKLMNLIYWLKNSWKILNYVSNHEDFGGTP